MCDFPGDMDWHCDQSHKDHGDQSHETEETPSHVGLYGFDRRYELSPIDI